MKLPFKQLAIIGTVVGAIALAFAFSAGWLTPQRLTPEKLVGALAPPGGPALGHRRNHARGVCFTGNFESNGQGASLSKAKVFQRGSYPVVGRFNIAGGDPNMPYTMAPVRGLGLSIDTPDGPWRAAMIDAPVFAAPTPEAFFAFLSTTGNKDAFATYSAAHPEILTFVGWAKEHARTESWAEDRFNGLNAYLFVDDAGDKHAVRWSYVPTAAPVTLTPEELKARAPDFLESEIAERVAKAPQKWTLTITIANAGDPTSDPTKAWPSDRRILEVGTLVAQKVVPEVDGPCRDVNFDPSVVPAGIALSDDPFPAARSAAYRVSHDRRIAESASYPHGGQP